MSGISDEEWQSMSPEERMEFQVKNCIFCKIIKGEIPSKKVHDDADFLGVLDINPGSKGHVLVLSKKHVQIMPQLGTELSGKLGVVVRSLSDKLVKFLGVKGVSVFVANGAVAGQNAPHFMLHIIPRNDNDGINLNPELKSVSKDNIAGLRNKVISSLGLPVPGKEEKDPVKEEKTKEKNDVEASKDEVGKKDETASNIDNEGDEGAPDKNLLDKISGMFK